MLKHVVVIVTSSIVVILGMAYAQTGLEYVISAHEWLSNLLKDVFSTGHIGNLIRELLALLVIPLAIGLLPAVAYWLAKRSWFPYFMEVVWVVWLLQAAALIVLYKVAS